MPLPGGKSASRSAKFGVVVVTGCMLNWGGRPATWSAYMSFNNRNVKLHSLPLDASTGGGAFQP